MTNLDDTLAMNEATVEQWSWEDYMAQDEGDPDADYERHLETHDPTGEYARDEDEQRELEAQGLDFRSLLNAAWAEVHTEEAAKEAAEGG
jgi:hypothetical protein